MDSWVYLVCKSKTTKDIARKIFNHHLLPIKNIKTVMTKLYNYVKYSFLSFWENKRSVPVNIRKKPWFTPKSKTARKKIHLAKKGNKSKNNDATIKISS